MLLTTKLYLAQLRSIRSLRFTETDGRFKFLINLFVLEFYTNVLF